MTKRAKHQPPFVALITSLLEAQAGPDTYVHTYIYTYVQTRTHNYKANIWIKFPERVERPCKYLTSVLGLEVTTFIASHALTASYSISYDVCLATSI